MALKIKFKSEIVNSDILNFYQKIHVNISDSENYQFLINIFNNARFKILQKDIGTPQELYDYLQKEIITDEFKLISFNRDLLMIYNTLLSLNTLLIYSLNDIIL